MAKENTKSIKKIVGERVKSIRDDKNLTREEFTTHIGYRNASTIAKLEAGNIDIPITRLQQICANLGVSAAFVLGELKSKNFAPDMSVDKIREVEQYETILNATARINSEMIGLVPESYRKKFATSVYNKMISDIKS